MSKRCTLSRSNLRKTTPAEERNREQMEVIMTGQVARVHFFLMVAQSDSIFMHFLSGIKVHSCRWHS